MGRDELSLLRYHSRIAARIVKSRTTSRAPARKGARRAAIREIERKYLLKSMPALPEGAIALRLRQGYVSAETIPTNRKPGTISEGRVRETSFPDGRVVFTVTLKKGRGLVRNEVEREISAEEFSQAWAHTVGRRVTKTRYLVPHGELKWEIDDFDEIEILIAEIELPSEDFKVEIPQWLNVVIDREVTDDEQFTNFRIAERIAAG